MPDKAPDNLSKEERSALQSLKNRDDIVIKKADKGSTVVVLDKETYMAEAHRQLSDERFYKKLDSDPTKEFSTAITKTLDETFEKNEIGINVYETLNPIDCRPGQFYLLPKIHKEDMISSSFSRSQKLVFSADDIKGWRFLSTVGENETSFIYVINTTNVCVGSICSEECDLTIVPEEDLSNLQNGTIKCKNRLQMKQCRMTGYRSISFSVKKSCRNHSNYTRLIVIDNRENICDDDISNCFEEFSFTSTTSQNPKDNGTDNITTASLGSSRVSTSNMNTVYTGSPRVSTSSITTLNPGSPPVSTSNKTTQWKTFTSSPMSNYTDLTENATPSCCESSKTFSPSKNNRKISQKDMDIALAVTVSISVLVVSVMLFLIGRLLYKTRHVTKTEPSIASFDIVNPSDGILEDPSGFLRETYIHIRKVSESNTDESPVSSPREQNQDSYPEMGVSALNSRSHYGEYSTFTGNRNSPEDFPHRYTAHRDRGDLSKPRK
ncbi:uncharacterized protein LOC133190645 [Saccostrea echinata]|uniref:uncharacterized protein LOC133190645 n=1 Tax=Saccostrea echinata TaxID=191078 RepID=UPI002A80D1D6|nr:uncharacterized protein LOC133190645 [Saccostrea echinata]